MVTGREHLLVLAGNLLRVGLLLAEIVLLNIVGMYLTSKGRIAIKDVNIVAV
jgi:hypothetical protein